VEAQREALDMRKELAAQLNYKTLSDDA